MKTPIFTRIAAFLLSLSLILSGCSIAKTHKKSDEQKGDEVAAISKDLLTGDLESLEQENYVLQHLDYLESDEYQEVLSVKHDLVGQAAVVYDEANQALINKAWTTLSKVCMLVGDEEIELTNEYDILLTDLMQSRAASENYRESYEKALCGALEEEFVLVNSVLKEIESSSDMMNGKFYDDVKDFIESTEETINVLHSLRGEEMSTLMPNLADFTDELKQAYKELLGDDLSFILDSTFFSTQYIGDVVELSGGTFSDFTDKYLFYRAASTASEEWYETWKNIAERIKTDNSSEAQRVYKSLNAILSEIDLGKNGDWEQVYFNSAMNSAGTNLFEYSAEAASKAFGEVCKKWPCGRYVKKSFGVGVSLSNKLMNCDDIAYYGQMMLGAGILARNTYPVLLEAATKLSEEKDYKAALYFDEAFHILKDIQIKGCDYAISFHQAIVENPAGYIMKYNSADHIADQLLILADKADWLGYECHGKVTDYYRFIHENLLPVYGYVDMSKKTVQITTNDYYANMEGYNFWDERSGLMAADIADMNMDGTDDLVVYFYDREQSPGELTAQVYSRNVSGEIYLIDTSQLTGTTACEDYHFSAGIITSQSGTYLYTEENTTGKFIDYADHVFSLYQLTSEGNWIQKYKMGQSGGGTSEVCYSLWAYADDDTYEETVLWADSEYRAYHEDVKIATPPGTSLDDALAFGFGLMGIPQMGTNAEQSDDFSYVWSLKNDVTMEMDWGTADISSVLTDNTEFRENMKPYDEE